MSLGWGELVVIFAIVLLIVGARRLPELGRSLGQAIREFRAALRARPGSRDERAGGKPVRRSQDGEGGRHEGGQPSEKR